MKEYIKISFIIYFRLLTMFQAILKAQYILTSLILMTVIRRKHYYVILLWMKKLRNRQAKNLLNEHRYKCKE